MRVDIHYPGMAKICITQTPVIPGVELRNYKPPAQFPTRSNSAAGPLYAVILKLDKGQPHFLQQGKEREREREGGREGGREKVGYGR